MILKEFLSSNVVMAIAIGSILVCSPIAVASELPYAILLSDISDPKFEYNIIFIDNNLYMQRAVFPGHLNRKFWKVVPTKEIKELLFKASELRGDVIPPFPPPGPWFRFSVIRKKEEDRGESQFSYNRNSIGAIMRKIRDEIIKTKSIVGDLSDAPLLVKEAMNLGDYAASNKLKSRK